MESQPQNPEIRKNPENFHLCNSYVLFDYIDPDNYYKNG